MGNRLKQLRKARDLSMADLAGRLGPDVSPATVDKHEKGKRKLSLEWLQRYADALGVHAAEIMDDPSNVIVWVRGIAQAGAFSDAVEWDRDRWYPLLVNVDKKWAAFEKFGVETHGPSMNEVYPEGTVCICVSTVDAELEPEVGKRYLVQRVDAAGNHETTIKELQVDDTGRPWLVPRSSDPAFQQPIPIAGEEGDTVEIVARVIASFREE